LLYLSSQVSHAIAMPQTCDSFGVELFIKQVTNLLYLSSQVSYAIAMPQTCDSFGSRTFY